MYANVGKHSPNQQVAACLFIAAWDRLLAFCISALARYALSRSSLLCLDSAVFTENGSAVPPTIYFRSCGETLYAYIAKCSEL